MRLVHALLGSACLILPTVVVGQPQPVETLWQSAGGSVFLTECSPGGDHDGDCRAISMKDRDRLVKLGEGYIGAKLLWSRRSRSGGPDALILGDYGGSGGNADLFAVGFSPKISFRKLGGERFDAVAVRPGHGALRLNIPFDIEFFNGAPHAGAITLPLPVLWADDDFALDLGELTRRTYSPSELDFRALAIREELQAWAEDKFPASRLYPPEARGGTPVTATALVEMMLSGHADQAHGLLDRTWPHQWDHGDKPIRGKDDFWAALCQAVVRAPFWTRFGLARLPHADLIEGGARSP